MDNERKIEYVDSSPDMLQNVKRQESNLDRLPLDFTSLSVGKSMKIPYELANEPSLRVRVSRENAKDPAYRYRLIKHGFPILAYEIGRVPALNGELPAPNSDLPPVDPVPVALTITPEHQALMDNVEVKRLAAGKAIPMVFPAPEEVE